MRNKFLFIFLLIAGIQSLCANVPWDFRATIDAPGKILTGPRNPFKQDNIGDVAFVEIQVPAGSSVNEIIYTNAENYPQIPPENDRQYYFKLTNKSAAVHFHLTRVGHRDFFKVVANPAMAADVSFTRAPGSVLDHLVKVYVKIPMSSEYIFDRYETKNCFAKEPDIFFLQDNPSQVTVHLKKMGNMSGFAVEIDPPGSGVTWTVTPGERPFQALVTLSPGTNTFTNWESFVNTSSPAKDPNNQNIYLFTLTDTPSSAKAIFNRSTIEMKEGISGNYTISGVSTQIPEKSRKAVIGGGSLAVSVVQPTDERFAVNSFKYTNSAGVASTHTIGQQPTVINISTAKEHILEAIKTQVKHRIIIAPSVVGEVQYIPSGNVLYPKTTPAQKLTISAQVLKPHHTFGGWQALNIDTQQPVALSTVGGDAANPSTMINVAADLSLSAILQADPGYAVNLMAINGNLQVSHLYPDMKTASEYWQGDRIEVLHQQRPGYEFIAWVGDFEGRNPLQVIESIQKTYNAEAVSTLYDEAFQYDFNHPNKAYLIPGELVYGETFSKVTNQGTILQPRFFRHVGSQSTASVGAEYGRALEIPFDMALDSHVSASFLNLGSKFYISTRIKVGLEGEGELTIAQKKSGAASGFKFWADGRGVLHVALENGRVTAQSLKPVLGREQWTRLVLKVDQGQADTTKLLQLFLGEEHRPVPLQITASATRKGYIRPNDENLLLFQRSGAFSVFCDYFYLLNSPTVDLAPQDIYNPAIHTPQVAQTDAGLFFDPVQGFYKITNDPQDLPLGAKGQQDQHPNPASAFYGLFRMEVFLDGQLVSMSDIVDVHLRQGGAGAWLKVAELKPELKNPIKSWVASGLWDSRVAAFDWSSANAKGVLDPNTVELKFTIKK